MALDIKTYIKAIGTSLDVALCLTDFPSEIVEKDNKPEIEMYGYNKKTKPLVLHPIKIAKSKKEKCLIEPSVNSCRISFTIKKNDDLDHLIVERFANYMATRATLFEILRRQPLNGYDISFLICSNHLEKYDKQQIIKFVCNFIEQIEKYMTEIKLDIVSQTRKAANYYTNQLSNPSQTLKK